MEENEDLRLTQEIDVERRHRTKDTQRRAEKERKDMDERVAKAIED